MSLKSYLKDNFYNPKILKFEITFNYSIIIIIILNSKMNSISIIFVEYAY